jgi:predicted nucleotidyltransferase
MSGTKQQILAITLLQPERSWYLLELARRLSVTPSTLQRELQLLTQAGILKREKNGNRVYFQADTTCPVYPDLAQLLFKTVGIVDALRKALEPLSGQIDVAFIYGSVAASAERSNSDIDLMIIGSAALSQIAPVLRTLEREVARPINPTVYSKDDFVAKVRREDHFLKSVLKKEPLFIKGDSNELAKLTAGATDKTPQNKRARARRPAEPH